MTKKKREQKKQKDTLRDFRIGDRVRVFFNIEKGERKKESFFEGQIIAQKGGGNSKTFTVRRLGLNNVAIERIFPLHSPKINRITVVEKAKKRRRAKLYYLREKK